MSNVTRRSLMVVPAAALRGSAANSAVSVGVVGVGERGGFLAALLAKQPGARVTAVCDLFEERVARARKATGAERSFRDYRDLLASNVDAVVIATPVYLHAEHFEAAVQSGKHIYIEKPASVDVAGCKRIMRAADAAPVGQNITFGFQRRYGQVFLKAKALVASGAIGRIHQAHAHWLKGIARLAQEEPLPPIRSEEDRVRQWGWWKATFGDSIVETFVHGIDVLNWFLGGHPLTAHGSGGRTVIRVGDILDHCNVSFSYQGGVQASLVGSYITPVYYRSVKEMFFGANGAVETSENFWTHHRGRDDSVTERSPRNIAIDAIEAFVQRVANGKPENTGVRGAESTLTAILGRMAIEQKREVTWDEMMRSA